MSFIVHTLYRSYMLCTQNVLCIQLIFFITVMYVQEVIFDFPNSNTTHTNNTRKGYLAINATSSNTILYSRLYQLQKQRCFSWVCASHLIHNSVAVGIQFDLWFLTTVSYTQMLFHADSYTLCHIWFRWEATTSDKEGINLHFGVGVTSVNLICYKKLLWAIASWPPEWSTLICISCFFPTVKINTCGNNRYHDFMESWSWKLINRMHKYTMEASIGLI